MWVLNTGLYLVCTVGLAMVLASCSTGTDSFYQYSASTPQSGQAQTSTRYCTLILYATANDNLRYIANKLELPQAPGHYK